MNELALFAGAGGGILGGHLLGWRTVCAVEWEPYPASVLCARQNDKVLPPFPIWDDVQTFDGRPWRGIAQVVSGGFPCQDISVAGKGDGLEGKRSSMWKEMSRIIGEVRPQYVFVENSPMLTIRGLGTVLGNLSEMGYDCKWGIISASNVGANHQRERIWIVGNTNDYGHSSTEVSSSIEQGSNNSEKRKKQTCEFERSSEQYAYVAYPSNQGLRSCSRGNGGEFDRKDRAGCDNQIGSGTNVEFAKVGKPSNLEEKVPHTSSIGQQRQRKYEQPFSSEEGRNRQANIIKPISTSDFWEVEPNVGRVANGVASRVDRLKAIGNGQVPLCAATAWRILNEL